MTRLLAIMGSGETAPTMIKPHRQLFDQLGPTGPPPVPAVLLDTPYGFQANADDISARAVEYFAASVGRPVEVAQLRRLEGSGAADAVGREEAMAKLARARWVFAGPGSPTYALRQWAGTQVPDLIADKLDHGGCVVFASAAALTLGRLTVPVYEIYKVGADPLWADGLDLLGFLGPELAVIPHYDNAEGGNHDTRFCYLGEPRLALLEHQMSDRGWVLGVDEHTACVFDLDAGTASVLGNGTVTVRRRGRSIVVPAGSVLLTATLVEMAFDAGAAAGVQAARGATVAAEAGSPVEPMTLHSEIRRLDEDFEKAVEGGDTANAVRATLELDDTLVAWSGDTTQSDATDRGRAALRRMIVTLGSLARDPRSLVAGFVETLLVERQEARAARRYADADRVRDALVSLGVEVRDTPDGTSWELNEGG